MLTISNLSICKWLTTLLANMKTTFALPLLLVVIFVSEAQAQYTLADVALHNTNDDCWSAAYGEIYDLTTYAPNHPNPSVYSMCGKDGTVLFDSIHGNVRFVHVLSPSSSFHTMLTIALMSNRI